MSPPPTDPEPHPFTPLGPSATNVEIVVVSMTFDAAAPEMLAAVLAKYVVMARGDDGCRNIDLLRSSTRPNRFVVVAKFANAEAQQAHFDSPTMVEMASACDGLLAAPPELDLFDPISAHDLH